MDQGAAEPELLPHPAGEVHRRPLGEGGEPGGRGELGDALGAGRPVLPEQAPEEVQVLPYREAGIEVTPEPLGHVGDALDHRVAPRAAPKIPPQDLDPSGLDLAHPGDDPKQGRLAHPVGPDQPAHTPRGEREPHPVEGGDPAVGVVQAAQSDDGDAGVLDHVGSLGARCAGQGTSGLTWT